MSDDAKRVGIFYQADDGQWYEIKKTNVAERLEGDPALQDALAKAGAEFPNKPFVLKKDGSAVGGDIVIVGEGTEGITVGEGTDGISLGEGTDGS
ncbi:MAG: hypothetical protein NXI18_21355 [Alphaproteobacteria bacterium]|nr:hypothetical protein [Alphaproteobacteria bacterium]